MARTYVKRIMPFFWAAHAQSTAIINQIANPSSNIMISNIFFRGTGPPALTGATVVKLLAFDLLLVNCALNLLTELIRRLAARTRSFAVLGTNPPALR
jgi:hypothetical protein